MICKTAPQDQSTIKYNNMKMILDIIRDSREVSRSEIARMTGMSPTSATRIVGSLEECGLVRDMAAVSNGVGRKAVMLDVEENAFYCIGLDISETNLKLCILNFGGQIVARGAAPAPGDSFQPEEIVEIFYRMYQRLAIQAKIPMEKVAAIGAGAVGTVDSKTGEVIFGDLIRWSHVPIGQMIEARFGLPTYVDNDVKCAIIGDCSTPPIKGADDVVLLSFGCGVGGAVIHRGRLVRGSINSAGEIGHTIVDYTDGRLCSCGRRGCAAAYLTKDQIIQQAAKSCPGISSLEEIMAAWERREPWAEALLDRISTYMAITVSNAACFLNPRNMILGGKLMNESPFLFDLVLEKYSAMMYPPLRGATTFIRSPLGTDATCVGGAMIAVEKHVYKVMRSASE